MEIKITAKQMANKVIASYEADLLEKADELLKNVRFLFGENKKFLDEVYKTLKKYFFK